jgi:hypothetical protein
MDWRFVLYTNLSVIYRPALLDISFDGKLDGSEHSPFRPITPRSTSSRRVFQRPNTDRQIPRATKPLGGEDSLVAVTVSTSL